MMTEKEYDALTERKELADKFSDFWHGNITSIEAAMQDVVNYGVVGLTSDDFIDRDTLKNRNEEDLELAASIFAELRKLKERCEKRTEIWDDVLDETNNELTSLEARIYLRNADEPNMALWPLDSFEWGMIEKVG